MVGQSLEQGPGIKFPLLVPFFDTGSPVFQDGLEHKMWWRMTLNISPSQVLVQACTCQPHPAHPMLELKPSMLGKCCQLRHIPKPLAPFFSLSVALRMEHHKHHCPTSPVHVIFTFTVEKEQLFHAPGLCAVIILPHVHLVLYN